MSKVVRIVVALSMGVVASVAGAPAGPAVGAPGDFETVQLASAGFADSTCALSSTGSLKCWGLNAYLGVGDYEHRGDDPGEMGENLPTIDVGTGRTVTRVAHGTYTTCVILDDGSLKCWGDNDAQGNGDDVYRGDDPDDMGDNLPTVDLGAGRSASDVVIGQQHTCAILDDDQVKCWGSQRFGQLGNGVNSINPIGNAPGEMGDNLPVVDLGTGRTATQLVAGGFYTCALLDGGAVKCWGWGSYGRLGSGDQLNRGDAPGEMGDNLPFVDLGAGRTAIKLAAGREHVCAILDDASLKCWGNNDWGQLGYGDRNDRGDQPGEMGNNLPTVDLGAGRSVIDVRAGLNFTCAMLDDESIRCWGYNGPQLSRPEPNRVGDEPGEMGDSLPAITFGDLDVVDWTVGGVHACVALSDGWTRCWGDGYWGQLGQGNQDALGDDAGEIGIYLPAVPLDSRTPPPPPNPDPCNPAVATEAELVACYAPHVLFHPDEDFYPMDVDDFVNGSVLKWQGCYGSEMLVNASPTPETLRLHAAHSWDLDTSWLASIAAGLSGGQRWCKPDDGSRLYRANELTRVDKDDLESGFLRATTGESATGDPLDLGQGFFLDWEDGRPAGAEPAADDVDQAGRAIEAPLYYERAGNLITYWFFYGYDPKADWSRDEMGYVLEQHYDIASPAQIDAILAILSNVIAIGDGATAHEGDWEHVTVEIGADGQPAAVSYAGHGCDEKRVLWDDVAKTDGTHPHVYVAEGSHASYPDEIELGDTYCTEYPKGEADTTAFDPDVSVEWRTWTGPEPRLLETECWFGFGGAWGEHRYFDTLASKLRGDASGPMGPPFNSKIIQQQEPITTGQCRPGFGWLGDAKAEVVVQVLYDWGDEIVVGFENGEPLSPAVFTLNSLPTEVARGTVDADGDLQVAFRIPEGTPPGPHRIVGQHATTGATFYASTIWVDAPDECLVPESPHEDDIDGDLLLDGCDPNLLDGPSADFDEDGVANATDNCPVVPNPDQLAAFPGRVLGAVCDERLGVDTTPFIIETDHNPPTIEVSIDPPLNPAGWATTPVTVAPICADVEGPVAFCSAPVHVADEGANQTVTVRAVDAVANETSVDVILSIDTTAPTVTIVGVDEGAIVAAADYVPPVCDATDALSGLNGTCAVVIEELDTNAARTTMRATATAHDIAGNATTTVVDFTVAYDIDAPTVTVTADAAANDNGWINTPVTFSFECDDATGVATCPDPVTIDTDGADQSFTVTASDVVGNTTEVTRSGINVDRTAPTLVVTAPAVVEPADVFTIECAAADALSGLDTTNCESVEIRAAGLAPGANEFEFEATDRAGNTTRRTVTVQLDVTVEGIVALIARYLGDTPGANGQLNSLSRQVADGDLDDFRHHVWAQCCAPAKRKRFTYEQAATLVSLAESLP